MKKGRFTLHVAAHTAFERGPLFSTDYIIGSEANHATRLEMEDLSRGIGEMSLRDVQLLMRDASIPSYELTEVLRRDNTSVRVMKELTPPAHIMKIGGWL